MWVRFICYTKEKVLVHNELVRVHSFVSAKAPLMACLSNGNSSSSPATTSSMTKFSYVSCDRVVWRWLTRHDLPSRRNWAQKKSLQSSTTGTLPEEAVWQGPTDALARSWSSSSEEIFSGPKYDEKATPIGSANTRSHFGPCNSLRCEWHPGEIELRWHICMAALCGGGLTLKYRSREISSKQYGAGQCQQISDVFLKQGRSFL